MTDKLTENVIDCIKEITGYGDQKDWGHDYNQDTEFNKLVIIQAIELVIKLYKVFKDCNFTPDLIVPGPASDGQSIDVEIQHSGSQLFFEVGDRPVSDEYFKNALNQLYEDLLKDQTQLPADMAKVLYDNLWELYDESK